MHLMNLTWTNPDAKGYLAAAQAERRHRCGEVSSPIRRVSHAMDAVVASTLTIRLTCLFRLRPPFTPWRVLVIVLPHCF